MFATRVNRLLISASIAVVMLAGCKGHGSSSTLPQVDTNWTWEAGSNVANGLGTYDSTTMGSATTVGLPSTRTQAMSWVDSTGQFWIFSGSGGGSDMWSFNVGNQEWTWQAGNSSITIPSPGVYEPPMGTPSPANLPGQRSAAATWVDSGGNLWMFGGYGTDSNGLIGYMSDLWSFNTSTKLWNWQGGTNGAGSLATQANWGAQNVAASSNYPNTRAYAAYWTSTSGKFYMFGGYGYLSGNTGVQNDLWEYDTSTSLWKWISGTSGPVPPATQPLPFSPKGVYGPKGQYVPANQPGGRQSATTWTDSNGNFWMFGGSGIDSVGAYGFLNDLWEYNPSSNQWIPMGGSVSINQVGDYGTNGVAAGTNVPGARSGAVGWVDGSNNLWLFGGYGINYEGDVVVLNDLWEFVSSSQQWIWINGSYYGGSTGAYGSLTVLSEYNMPGSRYGGSAWKDPSTGNFWMFGGLGYDGYGTNGRLNDAWKFFP